MIYDNLNLAMRTSEGTLLHDSTFHNMTAATWLAVYFPDGTGVEDLKLTRELWSVSPLNPNPSPAIEAIPSNPTYLELVEAVAAEDGCSPYESVRVDLITQICRVIIESEPALSYLRPPLSASRKPVHKLKLRKSKPMPARAIDEDEGTLNGNLAVLQDLRKQGGYTPEQAEYITLTHVDLATYDFIASLQRSTRREDTSLESKLSYIVCVPGMFHCFAAMGDAIVKLHVSGEPDSELPGSFYHLAGTANPRTIAKFHNRPGFRQAFRTINLILVASIRDCVDQIRPKGGLSAWMKTKPTLNDVVELCTQIYELLVASTDSTDNDPVALANQKQLHRNLLLYLASHQAMKTGDIGRFTHLLLAWIPIFRAAGKTRYEDGMLGFLSNLYFRWPKKFANIVRQNWLLNINGREDEWMGMDMLQEINNGKHKRSAGVGSNRSVRNIIKNSPVIRFFSESARVVSKNFRNRRATRKHRSPDASTVVKTIQSQIRKLGLNDIGGRKARDDHYRVVDGIQEGCASLSKFKPARHLHGLKDGDYVVDAEPPRAGTGIHVKMETD